MARESRQTGCRTAPYLAHHMRWRCPRPRRWGICKAWCLQGIKHGTLLVMAAGSRQVSHAKAAQHVRPVPP